MANNNAIICPFVDERYWEAGITRWIEWDMGKEGIRILLAGPSGCGKTTLAQGILSKCALHLTDCQIYVLDYKNIDFAYLEGSKHYYAHDNCTEGFLEFYDTFEERLANNDSYNWLFLYIDEYPSWLLSMESKKQKDIMSKMARLLNLSRAKQIHIMISAQKPLAELFSTGSRESLGHKVLLQAPSRETVAMLMPNFKEEIETSPTGVGYCTINDAKLEKIRVPLPKNVTAMREDLRKAVNK